MGKPNPFQLQEKYTARRDLRLRPTESNAIDDEAIRLEISGNALIRLALQAWFSLSPSDRSKLAEIAKIASE